MTRIAFIDYFPTHYRRRLYEEIGRRADADFFFFSDGAERWWNPAIPQPADGSYRRIELPTYRVAGQAVLPGALRLILGGRYDAVIKSTNGKLMLPLTFAAAWARGIPFVLWQGMWMHPHTPVHRFSKPALEGIYRGAGAIVCYGEHVRRFVLETRGVDPAKVFVAGQAADARRFEAVVPVRDGGPAEILYIGQFEEVKGLRYLLEAFATLGKDVRLRMIGGGSQDAAVRVRAERDQRIELVGFRSQEELPTEFARARCLVLPSVSTTLDRETWGIVVNEAMHAGVPVVATEAVGAAAGGLVRDGRNGYVVPERDSGALAGALRRLVDDRALAARMGDAAREDVREFTYERMATAFLSAVDYALAARAER